MGELPSQQPPDWWKSSGPWRPCSFPINCSAASVAMTRSIEAISSTFQGVAGFDGDQTQLSGGIEEPERLGRVADQEVLGLLVVVEHHLVVLAPDARLLVP